MLPQTSFTPIDPLAPQRVDVTIHLRYRESAQMLLRYFPKIGILGLFSIQKDGMDLGRSECQRVKS